LKNNVLFNELYEEYKDMVYNLSLTYVQNAEDSEEITQDVFLKVYQHLNNFEKRASIKTWIYRITINKSLDFIKAQKAKKRFSFLSTLFKTDSVEIITKTSDFNHPGIQLENKEAVEKLFYLINKLPYNQKTALVLKVMESLSQKEIAKIMKLSEKAVESLLSRAKKNLNDKIK